MICFNTERNAIYNKIIHSYLEVELFGDLRNDISEEIECYWPRYLYREQGQKCTEVFEDLYQWTGDKFLHNLDAFHEVGLYYFLNEMDCIREEFGERFEDIYYDEEIKISIDYYIKQDQKELDEEYTKEYLKENYYSPFHICMEIYEDIDFVLLPYIYNEQKEEIPIVAEALGIDLDYYFEILPMDIQKQYKNKCITLTGEIKEFVSFLQQRINYGSLAELFFENEKTINEKKIHVILENLMNAYFIGKGIDISREVLLKNGQVDFKLFRNDKKEEKVLIEVKKANNSYLKSGYEKQLCDYIKYSDCKNAFYLIVCFSDNDYKKANNFIENHVYTDNFQMYINIGLLDVRRKLAASKKH